MKKWEIEKHVTSRCKLWLKNVARLGSICTSFLHENSIEFSQVPKRFDGWHKKKRVLCCQVKAKSTEKQCAFCFILQQVRLGLCCESCFWLHQPPLPSTERKDTSLKKEECLFVKQEGGSMAKWSGFGT